MLLVILFKEYSGSIDVDWEGTIEESFKKTTTFQCQRIYDLIHRGIVHLPYKSNNFGNALDYADPFKW